MTRPETIGTPVGSYAPDFELPGIDDQVHHLSRYLQKFCSVCVIFMSNDCNFVKLYIDRLKQIQAEFSPLGFTLIGINGNDIDQGAESIFENMKAFAENYDLNFPYLWDSTQDVTRSFGTLKTPTAFLIDNKGILCYKGQIDNHPEQLITAGADYLKEAIALLFAGETIKLSETEQKGTALPWSK